MLSSFEWLLSMPDVCGHCRIRLVSVILGISEAFVAVTDRNGSEGFRDFGFMSAHAAAKCSAAGIRSQAPGLCTRIRLPRSAGCPSGRRSAIRLPSGRYRRGIVLDACDSVVLRRHEAYHHLMADAAENDHRQAASGDLADSHLAGVLLPSWPTRFSSPRSKLTLPMDASGARLCAAMAFSSCGPGCRR